MDRVRKTVYDYAWVQGILLGTVSAYIIFLTTIGPERVLLSSPFYCPVFRPLCRNHGSKLEQHGLAFESSSDPNTPDRYADHDEKLSDTSSNVKV